MTNQKPVELNEIKKGLIVGYWGMEGEYEIIDCLSPAKEGDKVFLWNKDGKTPVFKGSIGSLYRLPEKPKKIDAVYTFKKVQPDEVKIGLKVMVKGMECEYEIMKFCIQGNEINLRDVDKKIYITRGIESLYHHLPEKTEVWDEATKRHYAKMGFAPPVGFGRHKKSELTPGEIPHDEKQLLLQYPYRDKNGKILHIGYKVFEGNDPYPNIITALWMENGIPVAGGKRKGRNDSTLGFSNIKCSDLEVCDGREVNPVKYEEQLEEEKEDFQLTENLFHSNPHLIFCEDLNTVVSEIESNLQDKNKSYGDSALNPVRIFSKADSIEGIKVRIDDKLSRLANGSAYVGDNDVDDLIGYLVLLKIANKRNSK